MKHKVQRLTHDQSDLTYKIKELEVSITSKCHLRCENCGFYIPHQSNSAQSDNIISEIVTGLSHLQRLNIKIGSLGVLAGEPTSNQNVWKTALKEF